MIERQPAVTGDRPHHERGRRLLVINASLTVAAFALITVLFFLSLPTP